MKKLCDFLRASVANLPSNQSSFLIRTTWLTPGMASIS